ncbi:Uncharacterized protein ycf21 [Coccomyxa sp. Obi]|nr:Uncharacterized protein ycf21 [Coccomyxa sp. Obi]
MQKPLLWEGSWGEAAEMGLPELTPAWRMALLSAASVSRHLELVTGQVVETDCFEQVDMGMDVDGLPEHAAVIPGPRSQREVHLVVKGMALVCASTWWNTQQISRYLSGAPKPLWIKLSADCTELFSEITSLYCGYSPDLERRFGHEGPFWGREYIFWRDGQPVTLINEIFSPALEEYLGPMHV